jgi:hypothetical protein
MLISKETLEGIHVGELTDEQLDEAIDHYKVLEKLLDCHGEKYFLVWKDVYHELIRLKSYKKSRDESRNLMEQN